MKKQPILFHNHTDRSNFKLRDAINRPQDLIEYAHELGMQGVGITDHSTISAHIQATRYIKDNEHLKDFKLVLGEEFYLCDKEEIEHARENNEKVRFPHFLVLAKNQNGYEFIKKLTTREWENSFTFRGMQRTPTYYEDLAELIKGYKDDVIFTSACLGSPLSQLSLEYYEKRTQENKVKIHKFITFITNLVGKENFYLELQPAIKHDGSNADNKQEQQIVNDMLINLSKAYGLKLIVTTDAHYLNKEQAFAHSVYLKASQGDREVEDFYSTTYMMDRDELLEYFEEDLLDEMIENTHYILEQIEPITFKSQTRVPTVDIPPYEDRNLFDRYLDRYKYIDLYRHSTQAIDRYYLHLIGEGMVRYNQEFNEENLSRIDLELEQIWEISLKLEQALSSYFVLTKDIVDMMWEVSIVGTARGSASCYYTNYLLGIVQFNPIEYNLPYYRFLSKERASLPDIDIDTEASKREEIIELAKERFGHNKILNSCTMNTEGPKSTVLTAARGYGLPVDEQHNIANLIPAEGAALWSVSDCFFGNEKKGRSPVKQFIDRVEQHEGLKDIMLSIEGLVNGRSQHASSVIFYPESFYDMNAMMKTSAGHEVTQFNADDGEYSGELKLDFLSISALGRIREAFDLLVKDGKIEWKGSLRETYDAYFHPDVLDLDSEGMYDMLEQGQIFDAFQMSSLVARNAMRKIKPRTFNELAVTNTIIRLQGGHGESPIDKFVRYKNDISEWYKDMERYGLTDREVELLERHLLERTGICDTQEIIMNIIIDKDIANGGLEYANVFRKSIGKKDDKAIEKAEQEFKEIMKKNGHREEFANYITEEQFSLSYSYSFSLPHVVGYTLILLIEMNIAFHYGVSYWQTACLNASIFSGDEIKNKDYTSVAQFVNEIGDVVEPDINNSQMKFVTKEDKTLFALTGIIGLTEKTLNTIIEHRPFNSLEDFVERMVTTKLISEKQAVIMVKAGMFDNLENKTKRDVMVDLVTLVVPKRDNVTMVQLSDVLDVVPKQFNKMIEMWDFRKLIKGREKVPMNKDIEREFIEKYADKVQYTFENGELVIDLKDFDKVYNKEITPLKEELKKPQYAERLTQIKRREFWKENCLGTPEEWEIETILYNPNNFVLMNELIQDRYEISNFKELQDNPVKGVTSWGFNEYHLSALSGVVVGAEHPKRVIYLLTENSAVVPLKLTRKQYPYYTEKLDGDDSWANRGTKLIALGYRNGESFMVRGDKIYRNPLIKIEVQGGGYMFRNKKLEN